MGAGERWGLGVKGVCGSWAMNQGPDEGGNLRKLDKGWVGGKVRKG